MNMQNKAAAQDSASEPVSNCAVASAEELTLDPEDWEAFARLAHRMVDDMLAHLRNVRSRPAWQPMPSEVRERLREELPRAGQGAESTYREFVSNVMPYTNGNIHPRHFGWAMGNGTPLGMMADMLAAGINPHMAGYEQAPALVEAQVVAWLAELMGMPPGASGVLTLGASMANVIGLAVARQNKAGFDVRRDGLANGTQLTVYASQEIHRWLFKAVELLGLGRSSLRCIAVDRDFRIDLVALRQAIAADRAAGARPICVVGSAGTVNTGATDDLVALAALCREEGLWFHIDGAFGALARLSERLRPLVAGIEQADSIGFDLHKWMYQPFDVACVLVRDGDAHRGAFASSQSYLAATERGLMAGGLPFFDLGIDLTRGFRALKVWMGIKAHGIDTFAALIEQNVEQAHALGRRIEQQPELRLVAPVTLNVVCFRFVDERLSDSALDQLNQELLLRVQESGAAVPSSTTVHGRFALRCAIINHRSQSQDFDVLVESVVRIGHEILNEVVSSRRSRERTPGADSKISALQSEG